MPVVHQADGVGLHDVTGGHVAGRRGRTFRDDTGESAPPFRQPPAERFGELRDVVGQHRVRFVGIAEFVEAELKGDRAPGMPVVPE